VIAIIFLVVLLAIVVIVSRVTGAAPLPIGEIMMLIGLFLAFFGSGIYIAAVLGTLALLAGFLFSDRPFWPKPTTTSLLHRIIATMTAISRCSSSCWRQRRLRIKYWWSATSTTLSFAVRPQIEMSSNALRAAWRQHWPAARHLNFSNR